MSRSLATLLVTIAAALAGTGCSGGVEPQARKGVAPVVYERTELGVRLGTPKTADVQVVVWEDFGSADSKEFDRLSKKFLQSAAREGAATVEYRPYVEPQDGVRITDRFSFQAMAYEVDIVQKGIGPEEDAYYMRSALYAQQSSNPRQRIARAQFERDAIKAGATELMMTGAGKNLTVGMIDGQFDAAKKAGTDVAPSVFVNGERLRGSSPADLADKVRALVGGSAA